MPDRIALQTLSKLMKKDALLYLYLIRQNPSRFKDLPGNSFTKAARLKELVELGMIDKSIVIEKSETSLGYKLTDKGERIMTKLDELLRAI